MTALDVERSDNGEQTVLRITGEVDLATVDAFRAALLGGDLPQTVIIDLAGLTFMDSSGVHVLDQALRAAADAGRTLLFTPQFSDSVRVVLRITGMLEVLPIAPENGDGA